MGRIAQRVDDPRLRRLIRAFLNAGVMENGLVSPRVDGTPQGGPLSPLLSNVVLDDLDRELERRGLRFVRYRRLQHLRPYRTRGSPRDGSRDAIPRHAALAHGQRIEECGGAPAGTDVSRLHLHRRPDGRPRDCAHSRQAVQDEGAEITRRAKGVSLETTIAALAPYMRGWRNYFGFCETPVALVYLTRWVRLRLRAALWRQWRTPRRRRAALLALRVRPRLAEHTAGSGLGPWHLARAKALSVGLSNAYLDSLGLPRLIDGA